MRLQKLFQETDYRRGPRHYIDIDLPFEAPSHKWNLLYNIPMYSYTRGPGLDTWHELTMPSIENVVNDLKEVGVPHLPINKFNMYATFDSETEEFKAAKKALFPWDNKQAPEDEFHVDDIFNVAGSFTISIAPSNNQILTYGIYEDENGKERTVQFKPTTDTKLKELYKQTLEKINQRLGNAPK